MAGLRLLRVAGKFRLPIVILLEQLAAIYVIRVGDHIRRENAAALLEHALAVEGIVLVCVFDAREDGNLEFSNLTADEELRVQIFALVVADDLDHDGVVHTGGKCTRGFVILQADVRRLNTWCKICIVNNLMTQR